MMRALPLVLIALFATPAVADAVKLTEQNGSPAVEADGTSSTTISVLGGAASVTVEGSGSLNVYTHSGTVSGNGRLGVPQLGVSLGGALGRTGGDTGPGSGADGEPGGVDDPALAVDGTTAVALESDACTTPHGGAIGANDIAGFDDANAIRIALACEQGGSLATDLRDAIAGNGVMSAMLEARGYGAGDVRSVEMAGGAMVLFVAARD